MFWVFLGHFRFYLTTKTSLLAGFGPISLKLKDSGADADN
jgi:hypothetical protein